jgi:hypothetical protein
VLGQDQLHKSSIGVFSNFLIDRIVVITARLNYFKIAFVVVVVVIDSLHACSLASGLQNIQETIYQK